MAALPINVRFTPESGHGFRSFSPLAALLYEYAP
jgi:hypothetical protein